MRALKWVLLNGAFAAGVWVGFYEGHEGAQRVMVFLTCILFLVSMVAHSEASQKILATKGYPVPKTISITYDALITLALIYAGAWVTGVVYFLHFIIITAAFETALNPKKEEGKKDVSSV